MSDENNSEQSNESTIDSTATPESTNQEETQQASTGEQADTSSSIDTNGSEVGLQRKEVTEEVDEGALFSKDLDGLVKSALNGGLSDEQKQMLDSQGLSGHFDMIVNGHKANIAANDAEIVSVAGSKEAYGDLQEWGVANLSDAEIDAYNHAVTDSGDINLAKLAVEGLMARYTRVNGQAPSKRIEAGGTANDASRPYSNPTEYILETQSMKYRQDPAYAAQVEAKRNLSGF